LQTSDALRRENENVWLFEICDRFVAWMERSAIRDKRFSVSSSPDCAALHPGYEILSRPRCAAFGARARRLP
jgi:hypothetical protein